MPSFSERLQHAWNAFNNKDPTTNYTGANVFYGGNPKNRAKDGYRLAMNEPL
jgi:hypothetical protein